MLEVDGTLPTRTKEKFKELSSLQTHVIVDLIETSNKEPRDFLRTFAHFLSVTLTSNVC